MKKINSGSVIVIIIAIAIVFLVVIFYMDYQKYDQKDYSFKESKYITKLNEIGFFSSNELEDAIMPGGSALIKEEYILNTLTKTSSNKKTYNIEARVTGYENENKAYKILDNNLFRGYNDIFKKTYNIKKLNYDDVKIYIVYFQDRYIKINSTDIKREYKCFLNDKDIFIEFTCSINSKINDDSRGKLYYEVEESLVDIISKLGYNTKLFVGDFTNENDLSSEKELIARGPRFVSEMGVGNIKDKDVIRRLALDRVVFNKIDGFEPFDTMYIHYEDDTKALGNHLSTKRIVKNFFGDWESLLYIDVYETIDTDKSKEIYTKMGINNDDIENYKVDVKTDNTVGLYQIKENDKNYLRANYKYMIISEKTVIKITCFTYKDISNEEKRIKKTEELKEECIRLANLFNK